MKAAAENYKGIEYIQISLLPVNQKDEILKSLSDRVVIKILKNGELLRDCIQYHDYNFWYDNVFAKPIVQEKREQVEPTPAFVLALK